jgi:hypothetical protein
MHANQQETGVRANPPAPPTRAEVVKAVCDGSGRMMRRAGWGAATLVVLIVAGVCAGGCGNHSSERSAATQSSEPAVARGSGGGGEVAVSAAEMPVREANSEALAAASVDSLPPDVAATVTETQVFAGGSVEITAQGSPDVVGVTLGDRRGGHSPFAYDSSADLWRAAYRVPVKPGTDRLPLSVTARNASGRWRRVWVFLNIEPEAAATGAIPIVR